MKHQSYCMANKKHTPIACIYYMQTHTCRESTERPIKDSKHSFTDSLSHLRQTRQHIYQNSNNYNQHPTAARGERWKKTTKFAGTLKQQAACARIGCCICKRERFEIKSKWKSIEYKYDSVLCVYKQYTLHHSIALRSGSHLVRNRFMHSHTLQTINWMNGLDARNRWGAFHSLQLFGLLCLVGVRLLLT